MRNIYVVAHPEATHHVEEVVGGRHDSQLTPAGARAAASIGEALLSRIPGDANVESFSSDLQRALQAARVVGDLLDVEPILDRRLREKSYGEAEGKPQEWLDQRFVPPPQRVYAALDAILERSYEHQVIVTHGFVVTFVLASWIRMPIESLGYVNFRAASGSTRCSARTTTSTTARSPDSVTRAISRRDLQV